MIAVDSSSLVVYLAGGHGPDIEVLDDAIASRRLVIPPPVITEIASAPGRGGDAWVLLAALPVLEPAAGHWERAGQTRAKVLASGFKARVADALIAQSCIDHDVPLITRDRDFRHFTRHGLRLLP
jgi:hypothetical protein